MSIPARQIVAVNPRLLTAGGSSLVLNGLVLTRNGLIPLTSRTVSFTSADSVGDYFGYTSDEYIYSTQYFRSYDNSYKKPERLLFGVYVDEAKAAWIRGGKYTGTLATLKAITNGALKITINGTAQTISSLSLASASSLSDVATAIQGQLTSVAVTYSSVTGAFTITTTGTGASATIGYAETVSSGTDLGTTLNLTAATGAVLSQGSASQTIAENMSAIIASSNNWVCFTTLWDATHEEMLDIAEWAGDQGVEYLYLPHSSEGALTAIGSTSSIADEMATANVTSTSGQYSRSICAMISGAVASIDWTRLNGTIAMAFKQQDGIDTTIINSATDADILLNKKWNFIGNYSTRNSNFVFYYNGAMFGDYAFIDNYVNAVWLNNALQLAMMNAFVTYPRIPYTERGYTMIRGTLLGVVEQAKHNGVIDAGLTLSATQKAELISEYGSDAILTELDLYGYCIKVEDPGAEARVTRTSPNVDIWYTYGGSVQKIEISSTAII